MPSKKRITLPKAAALVLATLLAASLLYVSLRASSILSGALSSFTGLRVRAGLVGFSPAAGITVSDIRVENPPGYASPYLARISKVSVLPDYSELMRGEITIREVRITGPQVYIEKNEDGVLNAAKAAEIYQEKNRGKKPSGRKFSVGLIEVAGGRADLGPYGFVARLNNITMEGVSNSPESLTTFSLDLDDSRGISLTGKGTASLFSPNPTLDASVNVSAMQLGGYTKGSASGMLADAEANARLDVRLYEGRVEARLGGGISGVRLRQGEGEKPVQAALSAKLIYDKATDRIDIERALIRISDITEVGISGGFSGIKDNFVGRIGLKFPLLNMNVVNKYIPENINLAGVVKPGVIRLTGPVRPFAMTAEGAASLEDVDISYGRYGSGPVNGRLILEAKPENGFLTARIKAGLVLLGGGLTAEAAYNKGGISFQVRGDRLDISRARGVPVQAQGILGLDAKGGYKDGLLAADFGLDAYGGRLDGNIRYSKSGGTLKATAGRISLSNIKGLPVSLKGRLDVDLDARIGGGNQGHSAVYTATVSDASMPEKNASLDKLELSGDARFTRSGISANGTIIASGFNGWGRKSGSLNADYRINGGKLKIGRIGYKDEDLSVSLAGIDLESAKAATGITVRDISADFRGGLVHMEGTKLNAEIERAAKGGPGAVLCSIVLGKTEAYGIGITDAMLDISGDGNSFTGKLGLKASGNPLTLEAKAEIEADALKNHSLSGNLDVKNLETLAPAFERGGLAVSPSAGEIHASFAASGEGARMDSGHGQVTLAGITVVSKDRTLVSGVSCRLAPVYEGDRLTLPETKIDFGGYFGLDISAFATRKESGWEAEASIGLARTPLGSVQEGVIEALPERLMWADTSGFVSAGFKASYGKTGARLDGNVEFDAAKLELPDMGLYIGPAYGRIPVGLAFAKPSGAGAGKAAPPPVFRGETFDREHYPALVRSYSKVPDDADLVIDSIRYGFVDLEAVTLALTPGEGWYDIDWFGLSAFKGNLYGYGRADLEGGRHALSLIMSDFSLTDLCNTVPAIKGYLSGRVDGLMRVVLSGTSYTGVTGAATFWAHDGPGDEREISKEFIKKLMGSSMKKYMSLFIGDRYFDTGELDIVFSKGDLVFEKLLIANTNFLGQQDLNITVAPVSNRISIEHLLEVIRDVGSRAKGM